MSAAIKEMNRPNEARITNLSSLIINARDSLQSMVPAGRSLVLEEPSVDLCARVDGDELVTHVCEILKAPRAPENPWGQTSIQVKKIEAADVPYDKNIRPWTGDFVAIIIADDGLAMPECEPRNAGIAFFSDADNCPPHDPGLMAVYAFVRESGGCMDVQSSPGKGRVVSLFLPFVEPRTHSNTSPGLLLSGISVLALDTGLTDQETAIRQFETIGADVVRAGDVAAFDAALDRQGFDILLVACHLPKKFGELELAAKASVRNPGMKVLLLTNDSGMAVRGVINQFSNFHALDQKTSIDEMRRWLQTILKETTV